MKAAPPLQATISDLFPILGQTPDTALGDWFGDGRMNWLWMNTSSSTFETYSAVPTGPAALTFASGGPPVSMPPPVAAILPNALGWGRAMDVDGDGLTDLGDVPLYSQNWNIGTYFSTRDINGTIHPMAQASTATTCASPKSMLASAYVGGYSHATQRLIADVDGDGIADAVVLENTSPNVGGSVFGVMTAHVFKSRGDGRYGLGGSDAPPCANSAYDGYDVQGSTGSGLTDQQFAMNGISLHDIDGDGLADFVYVDSAGAHVATQSWQTTAHNFSFGAGPSSVVDLPLSALGCSATSSPYDPSQVSLLFGDMNASGVDDVIVFACGQMSWFDLSGGTRSNLLQTIANGAGAVTTLAYDNIKNLPSVTTSVPVPVEVVTGLTVTNGLSGPYGQTSTVKYTYDSPVYDARDREFVGFKNVTTTTSSDENSPGVDTTTHFATTACAVSPGSPCTPIADYPYRMTRGVPAVIEQKDNSQSAVTLTTTVNTYTEQFLYRGTDGRAVRQLYPSQWDEYLWDPTQQQSAQTTTTIISVPPVEGGYTLALTYSLASTASHLRRMFSVDGIGNPSFTVDYGLVGVDTAIMSSALWQLPGGDATGWNYRAKSTTTSYVDASLHPIGPVRESDFTYDSRGLPLTASTPLVGTMALERSNAYGNIAPTPATASKDGTPVLLSFGYDVYGNVTQVQQPGTGRCSARVYDPVYHQLPTQTQKFLGGCGLNPLTTTRAYDRGLERITSEISPSDAMVTSLYDGFGRLTTVFAPSDTMSLMASPAAAFTADYSLFDGKAPVRKIRVTEEAGVGAPRTSFLYYDAFGRKLVTTEESELSDYWVVQGMSAIGPSTGRVLTSWAPFFGIPGPDGSAYDVQAVPSGPSQAVAYNALGQVLSRTDELGRVSKVQYSPLTLSAQFNDPEQKTGGLHPSAYSTVTMDGHGRVAHQAQVFSQPVSDTVTTTYTYLATGELSTLQKTDTAGKSYARAMAYDTLGRLVANDEPNAGTWLYAYDDAGDLVGTSDARGCGENIAYDALGRIQSEDYSPCEVQHPDWDGIPEVSYKYDTPETAVANSEWYVGSLVALYDRAEHMQRELDGRGRLTRINKQITSPAGGSYAPHVFTRQFEYDAANHVFEASTGADVPELVPAQGSRVTTTYTIRGDVDRVDTTYNGGLLITRTLDASHRPLNEHYGDASRIVQLFNYNPDGLLQELSTSRTAGPWASASATYSPPPAGGPTTEANLQDLWVTYDAANNPKTLVDKSTSTWPAGMAPASRTMVYDDAYHVTSVTTTYSTATQDDPFDQAPYAAEAAAGQSTFPTLRSLPNRVRSQSFRYDGLDNMTASDDDQHASPDRSIGAANYFHELIVVTNAQVPARCFGSRLPPPPGEIEVIDRPNASRLGSATQNSAYVTASYDASGNTTDVTVTQTPVAPQPCDGPCVVDYQYNWDEVGQLQLAQRLEGATSASLTSVAEFACLYFERRPAGL